MSEQFRIMILGNTVDRRTEAEVYIPQDSADPVALVYEAEHGWVVENLANPAHATAPSLQAAIASAKQSLAQYVNRTGKGAPVGLTGPGLSLWLMEKADGTAMGRRVT
jgi:hypothetical protein